MVSAERALCGTRVPVRPRLRGHSRWGWRRQQSYERNLHFWELIDCGPVDRAAAGAASTASVRSG